jgi:hypothetical protein
LWYPGYLAAATGVTHIFLIVLMVDVCLGPLLTLVVYDTKKPELRRDLLVILVIQIAALAYGINTVATVRPVYLVFAVDRFEAVHANDITQERQRDALKDEFKSQPWSGPVWVSAELPDDPKELNDLTFRAADGGDDLAHTPRYYHGYEQAEEMVTSKAAPLAYLKAYNIDKKEQYNELLDRYDNYTEVGFLPLTAKLQDLTVIVDKANGQVLEITDLNPW